MMEDESREMERWPVEVLDLKSGGDWYAIHTRARHEKTVASHLAEKHISAFLPTVRETRVWSDRKKVIESPLFSCYVFVQTAEWQQLHMRVLSTPGVLRWVGNHGEPAVIRQSEIDTVRSLVERGVGTAPHPFLQVGQRVRVCNGPLKGIEGLLVRKNGDNRLVVSIDSIQKSMSVVLDGYDVVPT